jgi:hypothetical protein
MGRGSKAILACVVAGGLAASSVTSRGAFVVGFFFLFFGLIVGLVAWLAGGRLSSKGNTLRNEDLHRDELGERSPLVNETGVHRHFGDVLDLENHPEPGACGRVDRNWRETVISPFADRP